MNIVENSGFYSGPLNSPEHSHSCCEILYLKKGRIIVNIEGKEYKPKENSLYILSPMEKHAVTCLSEEYERYIIFLNVQDFEDNFSNPTLSVILKNRPAGFNHLFDASNPELAAIFETCTREYKENSHCQFTNQRMINLISELLILLFRTSPKQFQMYQDNGRLSEIQKYIENNYNQNIKISDIADTFYINQYYLSHIFKAYTGYSPKQYMTKTRFIHVRHLLATTDLKIAEIAEKTGFESTNDLSRQFKNEFAMSPREFRSKYPAQPYE